MQSCTGLNDEAEAAAQGILRYLSRHPDARDTVGGICQFWFPDWPEGPSKPVVQEALQQLVVEGLVIENSSRAAENSYGANKERLKARRED